MNQSILLNSIILLPFLFGLCNYFIGDKRPALRDAFAILTTSLVLLGTLYLAVQVLATNQAITATVPNICGFGLCFIMDGFRAVYGVVAAFMWAMVTLLSREYFAHHSHVNRFYLFLLWTLGATLGVFFSRDLMTTFIFFEIMSFTSYVWVAQEENRPALRAAETYLAVAVIGGLTMLMGLFMLYNSIGTLDIDTLIYHTSSSPVTFAAGICMLVGFGAKAGAFPLHIWLPKAHPVAPAPASALLSGILTKTGIYGTLILSCRLFHNNETWGMIILTIGVITMFGGALLAIFSIDLKRTLACSSMSQIGFILVGIGMQDLLETENQLALNGSMLHMMNHSMIKLVLFMAAGVIYQKLHALDLNVIRGYGRKKWALKIFFLIGALAIGGIPLFGGYISKTLLHESILEYHGGTLFTVIEWIFLLSGGITIAYMTKLFVAIFVEKNADEKLQEKYDETKPYMNVTSTIAMSLASVALLLFGLFPEKIMMPLAWAGESFLGAEYTGHHMVHFFSLENLKGGLISITIGALLYFLVVRKLLMKKGEYVSLWPTWLDLENLLYRPLLLTVLPCLFGILCRALDSLLDTMIVLLRKTLYKDSPLPKERSYRNPARHTYVAESNFIIKRSLSFGLMLACFGLALTMIYLLILR